jgi:hypothetical protein
MTPTRSAQTLTRANARSCFVFLPLSRESQESQGKKQLVERRKNLRRLATNPNSLSSLTRRAETWGEPTKTLNSTPDSANDSRLDTELTGRRCVPGGIGRRMPRHEHARGRAGGVTFGRGADKDRPLGRTPSGRAQNLTDCGLKSIRCHEMETQRTGRAFLCAQPAMESAAGPRRFCTHKPRISVTKGPTKHPVVAHKRPSLVRLPGVVGDAAGLGRRPRAGVSIKSIALSRLQGISSDPQIDGFNRWEAERQRRSGGI